MKIKAMQYWGSSTWFDGWRRVTVASKFFELEASSPNEALYMVEERLSDMYRSEEKLWQAAAISSYGKFFSVPVGGSGKGPEAYRGPLAVTDLKLLVAFNATPPWGDGRGKGWGLDERCCSFIDTGWCFESSWSSYSSNTKVSCSAPSSVEGADNARVLLLVTLLTGWIGFTLVLKLGGADCSERVWIWGSGSTVATCSLGLTRFMGMICSDFFFLLFKTEKHPILNKNLPAVWRYLFLTKQNKGIYIRWSLQISSISYILTSLKKDFSYQETHDFAEFHQVIQRKQMWAFAYPIAICFLNFNVRQTLRNT